MPVKVFKKPSLDFGSRPKGGIRPLNSAFRRANKFAKSLPAGSNPTIESFDAGGGHYNDYRVRWQDARGNPARRTPRRKTARRKNAPKSQSKLLKNFTGVVRLNADKTVSIVGTGKKPNPAKKRRAKR